MDIKTALTYGSKKLNKTTTTPILDTEILLCFILKKPKEYLYSYSQKQISQTQKNKFKKLIARRAKSEPIAYITGYKEFYGLNFKVDKRVLIPRPETEIIIDEILKLNLKKITIADIGTGSGCIAITLAKLLPKDKIIATDVSKLALQLARQNAKTHETKIKFVQGNLLEPINNEKVDLIVANLPYGWEKWKNNTSIETKGLKFEPPSALFTKKNGLYLYDHFFNQISKLKKRPQFIIAEFDPRQTNDIKKLIIKYLPSCNIQIKKDLAGHNRIVIIKL